MTNRLYYVKWEDVNRGHMRLAASPVESTVVDGYALFNDVEKLRNKHGKGICYAYYSNRWYKYYWFTGGMVSKPKCMLLKLKDVPKTIRAMHLIGV